MNFRKSWNALAALTLAGAALSPYTTAVEPAAQLLTLPLAAGTAAGETQKRLVRGAMQGDPHSLQTLLLAEFDQNWPQFKGHLLFLPYDEAFQNSIPGDEFRHSLWEQFLRSDLAARRLPADPDKISQLRDFMAREADDIYAKENARKAGQLKHGHAQHWFVKLPAELAGVDEAGEPFVYHIQLLRLQTECISCAAVQPRSGGGTCRASHPDALYMAESDQLGYAFHELGHIVAEITHDRGHHYISPAERNLEEVRANLFGGLAKMRVLGPAFAGEFKTAIPRTSHTTRPAYYFNPYAYRRAAQWVEDTGAEALVHMPLSTLYDVASTLAQQVELPDREVLSLQAFAIADPSNVSDLAQRVSDYTKANGQLTLVTINGKPYEYTPLVAEYDQAKLEYLTTQTSLHDQLQKNILRPPAMRANKPYQFDAASSEQVAAYNTFNRTLYGDEACQLDVVKTPTKPNLIQLAMAKMGLLPRSLHRANGMG